MVDHAGPRERGQHGSDASPASPFRRFLPDIDHRTAGEILAHPEFSRMRRFYIVRTMARYDVANFPGKLQSAAYRVAAIASIVCRHAAYEAEDRATWPTLAHVKASVATFSLSSARQIDSFVARLVETGHVALERVPTDGRLRLLRPTERLLDWDRAVMEAYYESLQILYPEPGYGMALAQDPHFHLTQRRVSTRYFSQVAAFMHENTDLLPFHGMYQAVHMLMTIANLGADAAPAALRERDFAPLQERFGISRSHIRNTLAAAEKAGLLVRSGQSPWTVTLTPRGLAALDLFIANTLAGHDLAYRLAAADLGRPMEAPKRPTGIP